MSDVSDKRKRDGIDGEASVNVAAVDNKPLSALTDVARRSHATRPQFGTSDSY